MSLLGNILGFIYIFSICIWICRNWRTNPRPSKGDVIIMQTISAKEARKIVKDAKIDIRLSKETETTQILNQYISQINKLINTAAKDTKTSVSIKANWNPKFDKKLKRYYKSFGYAVSVSSYSGCRFLSLSWHPCLFRRIWGVLK